MNTENHTLSWHLPWLCPASTAVMAIGLLSNMVATAVFMDKAFAYMTLAIEVRIHLLYNMIFLVIATSRLYSGLSFKGKPENYPTCVTINWFYQTIDKAVVTNLLLILVNRFHSIAKPDVTHTQMEAIRLPVTLNAATLVLATIPASLYRRFVVKQPLRDLWNGCLELLLAPYARRVHMDWMLGLLSIGLDGLALLMLVAVAGRLALRARHARLLQAKSFTQLRRASLSLTLQRSGRILTLEDLAESMTSEDDDLTDSYIDPTETVCTSYSESRVIFTAKELRRRDNSLTKLTIALSIGYLLFETPQHVPLSLFVPEWGSHRFSAAILALFEMSRMLKVAGEFFLFRYVSGVYRSRADSLFEIEHEAPFYTDMDLAYKLGLLRKPPRKPKRRFRTGDQGENDEGVNGSAQDTPHVILEDFSLPPEVLRLQNLHVKQTISPKILADESRE